MDREELNMMIREGPVRITMNSGQVFEIPSPEFAIVSDISAYVLLRSEGGKLIAARLPLVTISAVEEIPSAS